MRNFQRPQARSACVNIAEMLGKPQVRFVLNKIFLITWLLSVQSAAGFNDCLNNERNDSKIRIGFLSRYKSSKVSVCRESFSRLFDVPVDLSFMFIAHMRKKVKKSEEREALEQLALNCLNRRSTLLRFYEKASVSELLFRLLCS